MEPTSTQPDDAAATPPDMPAAPTFESPATPAGAAAVAAPLGDVSEAPPETAAEKRLRAWKGLALAVVIGAAASGIAYWAQNHAGRVATVAGQDVPRSRFNAMFKQVSARYAVELSREPDSPRAKQIEADLRTAVVRELVDRELVRQEAAKRQVLLPDALIDAEIKRIEAGFPDAAALDKMLADQGATREGLREQVRAGMLAERLGAALGGSAVNPTPAEVKAYYTQNLAMYKRPEEVRARHILVKEEALVKQLQREIAEGKDFSALATKHSTDPGSGARGGDLGFFGRGRMVPPFEAAAFALKPGQVSKPVQSQFGWHLIKVEERRAERVLPFTEVEKEIAERMAVQRRKSAFDIWIARQRADAAVTYAEGFAPPSAPSVGGEHGHEGH